MSQDENLAAVVSRRSDIGSFIRAQREAAQVSVRQLAEKAGVSNPYLSQIERGLRKPSAEVLSQIAKALRVSAEVLYVQAGILEPGEAMRCATPSCRHGDQRAAEAGAARHLHVVPVSRTRRFRRSFHLSSPSPMPCRTNKFITSERKKKMSWLRTPTVEDLKAPLLAAVGAADLALATVNEIVVTLRERAEDARTDASERAEESRAKLTRV
jgi:transcriptional regulator with XRE-family HTH domain